LAIFDFVELKVRVIVFSTPLVILLVKDRIKYVNELEQKVVDLVAMTLAKMTHES
jgi:hypothetical protein